MLSFYSGVHNLFILIVMDIGIDIICIYVYFFLFTPFSFIFCFLLISSTFIKMSGLIGSIMNRQAIKFSIFVWLLLKRFANPFILVAAEYFEYTCWNHPKHLLSNNLIQSYLNIHLFELNFRYFLVYQF